MILLIIIKHSVSYFSTETPLTVAAVKKNANEVIMFLINGGAYFDFKNRNGLTAVHRAAIAGNSHNIKVRYISSLRIYWNLFPGINPHL